MMYVVLKFMIDVPLRLPSEERVSLSVVTEPRRAVQRTRFGPLHRLLLIGFGSCRGGYRRRTTQTPVPRPITLTSIRRAGSACMRVRFLMKSGATVYVSACFGLITIAV